MDNLTKKIINQIQTEEIKPIPKQVFLLRNIGFWLLSVLSVGLGSISTSLLMYNVANKDWDIYSHLSESLFGFIISSLPYLWIILVIISLTIAILNFEHSKNGYKYSPLKITITSILLALILGFSGYSLGFGGKIDTYLGSKFTSYHSVEAEKETVWSQPEKGLFSGRIQAVDPEKKIFTLADFQGRIWTVDYSNAFIRGKIDIQVDSEVKIIGEKDEAVINASDIRPWRNSGGGQGLGNNQGRNRSNNASN
jgi:hypothetical protein